LGAISGVPLVVPPCFLGIMWLCCGFVPTPSAAHTAKKKQGESYRCTPGRVIVGPLEVWPINGIVVAVLCRDNCNHIK